jgi:hypothetical protein
MKKLPWTPEEQAILTKLGESGCTLLEVVNANIFKSRTRDSIASACQRYGISLAGKAPEIDMEKFKQLIKERLG